MADLPHFLPFWLAHEVNHNFPLCELYLSRPDESNYILRINAPQNHPIYKRIQFTIRIDIAYVCAEYTEIELCVTELLEALVSKFSQHLRPNISQTLLEEFSPWMNSPSRLLQPPRTPSSADTTPPEPTPE